MRYRRHERSAKDLGLLVPERKGSFRRGTVGCEASRQSSVTGRMRSLSVANATQKRCATAGVHCLLYRRSRFGDCQTELGVELLDPLGGKPQESAGLFQANRFVFAGCGHRGGGRRRASKVGCIIKLNYSHGCIRQEPSPDKKEV